jgi:hypothetical protein
MESIGLKGKYSTGQEYHEIEIPIIIFEDNDLWFFYAPSLDLTGYGPTREEAEKSFHTAFGEFIKYTVNKKSIAKVLLELGWTFKKWNKKQKLMTAPSLATLLTRDKYLSEIFDEKKFEKTNKKVTLPLVA